MTREPRATLPLVPTPTAHAVATLAEIMRPPIEPRATCARCRRPTRVCYCHVLPTLPTRTRVLLLQHPAEEGKAIGTAFMSHLCLPNSQLRVGLRFANDPVVVPLLAAAAPTYLLFPGDETVNVTELPRDQPINLVVVDGTWWQARKLIKLNPAIAALPRVGFFRATPSEYRIRREPADFCVSTIEALAEVLKVLECEPGARTFDRLLDPFRTMVEQQLRFKHEIGESRHQRSKQFSRAPRRPSLGAQLTKNWGQLVCVQGEANAWPRNDPAQLAPETVHWVAHRPATGETFESIIAPRVALAPSTTGHIGVTNEALRAGVSLQHWLDDWQAFCRPDDVLVHWGGYYPRLAQSEGLTLPDARLDLRCEIRHRMRKRVGTLESCLEVLAHAPRSLISPKDPPRDAPPEKESPAPAKVQPRAQRRLQTLLEIVDALRE